ncbi:hypothetical protein [Streptomyces misionensis]|uniref:hypothetical protein n=1 Tax=Streptomyces misionensis TaxID=67331 RepID=UPI0036938D67
MADKVTPVERKAANLDEAVRELRVWENIAGTQWAIQKIRDEGPSKWGPDASRIADWLEGEMRNRTADLKKEMGEK